MIFSKNLDYARVDPLVEENSSLQRVIIKWYTASDSFTILGFGSWNSLHPISMRPTLKIFVFPLTRPCFNGMGGSVGNFFLNFSNWIPIKLNCIQLNLSKEATQQKTKIVCFIKTNYHIMQAKSIAECSQGAFCNTFNLHLALICLNNLCCVYL